MNFEILSSTEAFVTLEAMVRLFICVCPHVDKHLISEHKKRTVKNNLYVTKEIIVLSTRGQINDIGRW